VPGRVSDERHLDAVRDRVAERQRVRGDEQRTAEDRHDQDDDGPLRRGPAVLA
jgi:hypothetical protein